MKKWVWILVLVLAAYFFWRWWNGRAATAAGAELVYNRVWIDHQPTRDTDSFQLFAVVTEQPLGLFQETSAWRGRFEVFRYEPRGDAELALVYPQTSERERVQVRATRCREQRFDYCLELSGASRGVRRYYSQTGWEIGAASDGEALHRLVEDRLRAR